MADGVPKADELIPSVDPEDLRRRWNIKPPWTSETLQEAAGRKVNSWAVSRRDGMVRMLANFNDGQLLAPWRHGVELDDAVFRVAATCPMRVVRQGVYKIAGDEIFGFDPNAFVQRLVEETGISHVWEPIPDRLPEGGWSFNFIRATFSQTPPDLQHLPDEREAKRCAREVLWDAWSKYFQLEPPQRDDRQTNAHIVALLFADFVIDNLDLARQLMSLFGSGAEGVEPFAILTELERKAKAWVP
jgi:hypothetical protein